MAGGCFSRVAKFGNNKQVVVSFPLKFKSTKLMPNQPNPMVITLDHFNTMRENFKQHYFLSQCNANFGGQDIQIPWPSFALAVQNFIQDTHANPNNVALRFVLCYDTQKNELYLRLQICTMIASAKQPNTFILDTTKCAWYTIANGSIAPTGVTDLFDQNYLNSFYYCEANICSPASLINLASDKDATRFVRNIVFPWTAELEKIYNDNGTPPNASVCFAAASEVKGSPVVTYPHTLAIYLRQGDGTMMIDNKEYPVEFKMKAGDMGTLCPSVCAVYVLPL